MKGRNHIILIFSILILVLTQVQAQLIEVPLPRSIENTNNNLRTKADTVAIELPLWDDFSTSNTLVDTSFWVANSAVFVNPGIGINPPSINVATLDGWDAFGTVYDQDPEATGKTDSLLSRPIDLTKVPASIRTTIFLSFYYQQEGNGDIPNENDSLVLQFKKPDGSWETVWPLPGEVVSPLTNFFTQKILQVTPEYIWEGFQFKFQAYGRQNGPFDTWNLDYIYLDKRRSINDLNHIDRTFTTVPTSIFMPYTAMPIDHFFLDPLAHLDSSAVEFTNLERQVQPVEYSVVTKNFFTKAPIDTLLLDSAFLALRFPLGSRTLKSGILDPLKLDDTLDSIVLETTFYMDSGDDFLIDSVYNGGLDTVRYNSIDLRVNDTTKVVSTLSDYYAYDDGTAEFGAGINQLNGRLAQMFVTNTPGTVTAIDINFQDIGGIIGGIPIELFVVDSLVDNRTLPVTTSAVAQIGNDINDFFTYNLSTPIDVIDTFFVGYLQTTVNFLPVGLDKNTQNGNKIWFNITGVWERNVNVDGSLMIRPRFGNNPITAIESELTNSYTIYPNPTRGKFTVKGKGIVDEIRLFDLQGRSVRVEGSGHLLDVSHLLPAVYILRIRSGRSWSHHKLIRGL